MSEQMDLFTQDESQKRLREFAECQGPETVAILDLPSDHPYQVARRELVAAAGTWGSREGWALAVVGAWLRGDWVPASAIPILERIEVTA